MRFLPVENLFRSSFVQVQKLCEGEPKIGLADAFALAGGDAADRKLTGVQDQRSRGT